MTIILRIENCDQLPDGGPIEFRARQRNFEIGREQHLDWTLPDSSRYISGRHCEVRFENGAYRLYDVSRNGTFLNGAQSRMKSPYHLQNGDRLHIGNYIVSVTVEGASLGDSGDETMPAGYSAPGDSLWDTGEPAPAPLDRRDFLPPQAQGRRAADFSEQYIDLPDMQPTPLAPRRQDQSASPFADPRAPEPVPYPQASESPFGAPSSGRNAAPAPNVRPTPGGEPFAQPASAPLRSPAATSDGASQFLEAFAAGAGVSSGIFSSRNPQEVAHEVGIVVNLLVTQLAGLLKARAAAKAMTKSSKRTMLSASDNNPLKFIPTPAEIIEVMFAGRPGYLDARGSVQEAFDDLEAHEIATFAAMQKALSRLLDSLSPQTIESKLPASTFSSKKARAWESYVERWDAMTDAHEHGILNVFLGYFAEAYDEAARKRS